MRYVMLFFGAVLLLLGVISLVTPIPGGMLAITFGAGLIICASQTAANCLKALRAKNHRVNKVVTWLENKIGERLSAPLRMTRPE